MSAKYQKIHKVSLELETAIILADLRLVLAFPIDQKSQRFQFFETELSLAKIFWKVHLA